MTDGGLSMSDLRDLYQEVILDHNAGRATSARLKGHPARRRLQPALWRSLSLYLKLEDGVIEDASFEGAGAPSPRLRPR